jgi:hypothetical protein
VVVADEADNMAAYQAVSATTKGPIHAFSTAPYACCFGRVTADQWCENAYVALYSSEFPGDHNHALISFTNEDSVANMTAEFNVPEDRPIVGPTTEEVVIAPDWADLLDGSIEETLETAGVVTVPWWSGSTADGSLAADSCDGWTDGSVTGVVGSHSATDSSWIAGSPADCGVTRPLLCLAWD